MSGTQFHSSLIVLFHEGRWSGSRPGRFSPRKIFRFPLNKVLLDPEPVWTFWIRLKYLADDRNRAAIGRPQSSHYTESGNPANHIAITTTVPFTLTTSTDSLKPHVFSKAVPSTTTCELTKFPVWLLVIVRLCRIYTLLNEWPCRQVQGGVHHDTCF
jgi:hypothetical protein